MIPRFLTPTKPPRVAGRFPVKWLKLSQNQSKSKVQTRGFELCLRYSMAILHIEFTSIRFKLETGSTCSDKDEVTHLLKA